MFTRKRNGDGSDQLLVRTEALLDAYRQLLRSLAEVAGEMARGEADQLRADWETILSDLGATPNPNAIATSRGQCHLALEALAEAMGRRERQFRDIITLLARSNAAMAETGMARSEELRRRAEKIEEIARLESPAELRRQLSEQVAELRQLAVRVQEESAGHARRMREELEHARAKLQYTSVLATTDPLTGLGNRRKAEASVAQALAAGEPISVVMLDINEFKDVNDLYGHNQGDSLLRLVGNHVLRSVREADVVCRWGGDEFVVVMRHAGLDLARAAMARIQEEGFGDFVLSRTGDPVRVTIGASMGAAEAQPGDTAETLLDRADRDMYAEKRRRHAVSAS